MTREEAMNILLAKSIPYQGRKDICEPLIKNSGAAEGWIDIFVALGMLKLEQPKSGWDEFIRMMNEKYGYSLSGIEESVMSDIREALDRAGLQIVEKK